MNLLAAGLFADLHYWDDRLDTQVAHSRATSASGGMESHTSPASCSHIL